MNNNNNEVILAMHVAMQCAVTHLQMLRTVITFKPQVDPCS